VCQVRTNPLAPIPSLYNISPSLLLCSQNIVLLSFRMHHHSIIRIHQIPGYFVPQDLHTGDLLLELDPIWTPLGTSVANLRTNSPFLTLCAPRVTADVGECCSSGRLLADRRQITSSVAEMLHRTLSTGVESGSSFRMTQLLLPPPALHGGGGGTARRPRLCDDDDSLPQLDASVNERRRLYRSPGDYSDTTSCLETTVTLDADVCRQHHSVYRNTDGQSGAATNQLITNYNVGQCPT